MLPQPLHITVRSGTTTGTHISAMQGSILTWLLIAQVMLITAIFAPVGAAQSLDTPLRPADFDPKAAAIWGQQQLLEQITFDRSRNDPSWVIWTQTTQPGFSGFRFGQQWTQPGPRHLRIGFTHPVPIGAVLLRADPEIRLSVLRSEAPYPGDPDNEDHWLMLERVHGEDLAWWLAPQVLQTRALRFSYDATADAPTRGGWLGGVYVFAQRVGNLAPAATPIVSARPDAAHLLIDGRHHDWWDLWSNLGRYDSADTPVSADNPQWVMLYWPQAVTLDGVWTVWSGLGEAQVQVYQGPDDLHPREADSSHWRVLETRSFPDVYPQKLGINRVDFAEPVTTRAVRLLITSATPRGNIHSHARDKYRDGTRVWIGELYALRVLKDQPLAQVMPQREVLHPPIPIRFTLDRPGFVTLVIDDAQGNRVRNLIAEQYFEAGEHVVYWDGKDESIIRPGRVRTNDGRIREGIHGIYEVDGRIVEPGTYSVRGLLREEVRMHYQLSVNNAGSPPWSTPDGTGRWLADHSPPSDALFIDGQSPQMILSARVAEAGEGVIWTDLDGRRKRGIRWLGGHWTGAYFLAADAGPDADRDVQAYAGSTWRVDREPQLFEVRISALTADGSRSILNHRLSHEGHGMDLMRGLAVRDGRAYITLAQLDQLMVVDVKEGKVLGVSPLPRPAGLAFDTAGHLLALSEGRLLRYDLSKFSPGQPLPEPTVVVAEGLSDPCNLTIGSRGHIYISDRGTAHDVKVFNAEGRLIRTIGTPGGPQEGPYDPTRMHSPAGLAVDNRDRLWVAEADEIPKRVSVWSIDGQFIHAFYGPPQYGGGGTVDPKDPSRFYYAPQDKNATMEFHIDWETGQWKLTHVMYRPKDDRLGLPNFRGYAGKASGPQWPIYVGDRQYMTNAFNSHPTNGSSVVGIWLVRDHLAKPVALAGRADTWPLLRESQFASCWPQGMDPAKLSAQDGQRTLFVWSDLNIDGRTQPQEVSIRRLPDQIRSIYVREDLTLTTSYTWRIGPRSFTDAGVPVYHVDDATQAIENAVVSGSSGGGEAIDLGQWIVITGGPMRGYHNGRLVWTYPSQWPGLHAGHQAPQIHEPGQLVATTRILGQPFRPPGTDVDIWAINGDQGQIYLLTLDGLFVATLGRDARALQWRVPYHQRGMRIDHLNLIGEHFWPSIVQPQEGPAILVAGKDHSSVVTVEGLESIHRLPPMPLEITSDHVLAATQYQVERARQQLALEGRQTLRIRQIERPLQVSADPSHWDDADWVTIDDDTDAALALAGDRLFVALRSRRHHDLLNNTGEALPMLFKTGGAIDLMIGVDPQADPDRAQPVPGDQRLLVTRVGGQTRAVLYQAKVPGTDPAQAHPFSSPWRTVYIDRVIDLSQYVELAHGSVERHGVPYTFYEWSVPVSQLGWTPAPGQRLRGDIGLLRGQGGVTVQRVYWQNKATGIVEDIPSEAALTPALWGIFEVVP